MKKLEQFRIRDDNAHQIKAEPSRLDAGEFFRNAKEILDGLSAEVLREVIPNLEQYPGRWHPNGFLVYPLGARKDVGSLRLHIWPTGTRIKTQDSIHDHAWHLTSKVLSGVYQDQIYTAEKQDQPISEDDRKQKGLLRVFKAVYTPGKPDVLETDGTCLKVVPDMKRSIEEGTIHTIEKGVIHRTIIPADRLVATLVLDSPTVGSTIILMDGPADRVIVDRKVITPEESLAIKAQFNSTEASNSRSRTTPLL